MNNKVIIIGGVAGGASCAARLRRHNEQLEIILLERGSEVSFANCGLPYYIGDVIQDENALYLASTTTFRNRFQVDARTHSEVINIDRRQKKVRILNRLTGNSYDESYDFLVLAPGSTPTRPNLPGINSPGIFSLSDISDSKQIKQWIRENKVRRAIVIGGGFIGLEMTENLVNLGIETTIIEASGQLMPSVDTEMTAELEDSLIQHGVQLLFNTAANSFRHDNKILTVTTNQGATVAADLVILAIGVSPESDLARQCELKLGEQGHILVDANLRTSDPAIYAIGDCIEVSHSITGQNTTLPLAGPASRQGRIVADILAGRGRHFRGVQGTAICGVFDLTIASTGLNEKSLRAQQHKNYGVVYAHPEHHVTYYPDAKCLSLKLLFDRANGKILGAQAIGEVGIARRIDVIAMAIQMGATVFDLEESELCYAPQYGAAKDPVNLLGMIAANAMRGDLDIAHWDEFGQNDTLLLDVRDPDESRARPLPGAINIPLNDLRQRWHELRQYHREVPTHRATLVTCATGARANTAVRLLRNLGHPAFLLPGGEKTWAALTGTQRNNSNRSVHLQNNSHDSSLSSGSTQDTNTHNEQQANLSQDKPELYTTIESTSSGQEPIDNPSTEEQTDVHTGEPPVITEQEVAQGRNFSGTTPSENTPAQQAAAINQTVTMAPEPAEELTADSAIPTDQSTVETDKVAANAEALANVLGSLKILRAIPTNNAAAALQCMEQISVNSGDVITRTGEKNTSFYILFQGSAEKRQASLRENASSTLSLLHEGDHFNEEALISDGVSEADVTMLTDGILLYMSGEHFLDLIAAPLINVIDVQGLLEISSSSYRVIDVRQPEEIKDSIIPDAINIPLSDLRGKLKKLMLSQNYLVCSNDGKRSAVATMILRQHGYRASSLQQGLNSWPHTLESLTQRG